jgi:[protein-PII] uridylyltransferase
MDNWGSHHKLPHHVRLEFDNESSSHSTLLQVVAPDTPGLLRKIGLALGRNHCNIEVALIDTEGEMAIDVFYMTSEGKKLTETQRETMAHDLRESLERHHRNESA